MGLPCGYIDCCSWVIGVSLCRKCCCNWIDWWQKWNLFTILHYISFEIYFPWTVCDKKHDQVLKFMLKNQSVRILLNSTSDRRALHSESNSLKDTQIRSHMQTLEQVKVQVWLVYMAGLDDVAKVLANEEALSSRLPLALAYHRSQVDQVKNWPLSSVDCDLRYPISQSQKRKVLQKSALTGWVAMRYHNHISQEK